MQHKHCHWCQKYSGCITMKEISIEEQALVTGLLSGKTKAEAYRSAFKRPNLPAQQASSAAIRILSKSHVKAYYDREKKQIEDEMRQRAVWTIERGARDILWLIDISKSVLSKCDDSEMTKTTASNNILKGTELLYKIYGEKNDDDKSLARMLTDLDPDSITEDPLQYCAAGFKNE